MCHVLPLLLVGSSLAADGWAQARGTAKHASKPLVNMQTQSEGGLTVAFVDLPGGADVAGQHGLNLGSVSYAGHPRSSNVQVRTSADRFVVSASLGLSIQDSGRQFSSASLLVALAYPEPAHVLWLDGVRLTTALQMVQGRVPVGKTSAHRLEIEIPTSLTEKDAAVHNSIIFQVIPN